MDPSGIPLFQLADRRLAWLDRRQEVLARNLANADTPGFRPRDLSAFARTLSAAQGTVSPAITSPLHHRGTLPAGPRTDLLTGERAPDGNAVATDVEMTKVADTESTQELVTMLYKKYLTLFRTALGR